MSFSRYSTWFFAALVSMSLAASAHAQVLFGATAAGSPGQLVTLNPANGALLSTIGPTNDAGAVNYPITGLAFHPVSGLLYASTGNAGAANTQARLVTINPATAQVTVIGSFNAGPVNGSGVPATMADIDFDASGNLYGVGSIGGPHLYSINLATGQATAIGSSGISSTGGGGFAISPGGVFYGNPTSAQFGTYNPTTGVYTNIGTPSAYPAGAGNYAALSFNGNSLYGLNSGTGSPPPTHIVTFNTATAGVTDIGASILALDAIAFQPTPIPEPSSMLLIAGPAVAGLVMRIRRRRSAQPKS